jgi:hypothetical protein
MFIVKDAKINVSCGPIDSAAPDNAIDITPQEGNVKKDE